MGQILIILFFLSACADLTKTGKHVAYIEADGTGLVAATEIADKLVFEHQCIFIGYVDAETSIFPGSYSVQENEIHSALKNRAAKMGANLVIANFYKKPAQGVGLNCPAEVLKLYSINNPI